MAFRTQFFAAFGLRLEGFVSVLSEEVLVVLVLEGFDVVGLGID
jgi:hypothetical protein